MKFDWIITFRSVTFAQKGERVLRGAGVDCRLARTPRSLSERGCGYCLRLGRKDGVAAVALLRQHEVAFEKVYAPGQGAQLEERML